MKEDNMNKNELITVPENMKAGAGSPQEAPDEVEFDPSNPNYRIPHLTGALGKSALSSEAAVRSSDPIDEVPGRPRVQSAESERATEISPTVDPRKVPGTLEFEEERIRISNIARSEWALSGGVSEEENEK